MTERSRRPGSTVRVRVRDVDSNRISRREDVVATEEPLEIRIGWPGARPHALVVTMRTPGSDFELAAGFCYSEGLVRTPDQVIRIAYCTDPDIDPEQLYNVVTVELVAEPPEPPAQRYGAATAACGVCGKQSLDDLELRGCVPIDSDLVVAAETLRRFPDQLREAQNVFARTGGLHASGLFNSTGELLCVREDVGRHNALDKVVGWAALQGVVGRGAKPHAGGETERRLPLKSHALVVSGRVGFEITQKALAAGIPVIAAVGAPSSLAIDLAERFNLTLVGFLRGERFVIYTGANRIKLRACPETPGG